MRVNIKYVNFPKPGGSGKYGSIVMQDGSKIMVPADMLSQFRSGMTCDIDIKYQTWFRGTADEAEMTIAASGPLDGRTGNVQGQSPQTGYQRATSGQVAARPSGGFQPRVYQGGASAAPGPNADELRKDRHIFVTGVVQQAMSSGKFAASEIPVLTQAANEAYDLLDRGPAKQPSQPRQELLPPPLEEGDPGPELQ